MSAAASPIRHVTRSRSRRKMAARPTAMIDDALTSGETTVTSPAASARHMVR